MATFKRKLEAFLDSYEQLKKVEKEEAFLKEFMSLKSQSAHYREKNIYPAESGQLAYNRKKNRFKDIVPFEYTRVSLHAIEGVEGSDYVNANYIQGPDGNVTYIAAQGPLPHTVNDFWRMLWYHNIEVMVMACKLVELAKPKCECYWPNLNETKSCGPISVTTIGEENIANDFVVRDFVAECEGEKQQIRQYHYMSWPDHGRPQHPQPVVRMIEMVHDYRQRVDVPILVHCSAGCGRTGTIIAIDIARTMLLTKNIPKSYSPHDIVEDMRKQRPAMVQAKEQYIFVYMAMSEMSLRALGNQPQPPPKPDSRLQAPAKTTTEDVSVEGGEDPMYENVSLVGAPIPMPRSLSSSSAKMSPNGGGNGGDEMKTSPVAQRRTKQSYENVPNRSEKTDKPLPVPPVRPKPRTTVPQKPSDETDSSESTESLGSGVKNKPTPPTPPAKPPQPETSTESLGSGVKNKPTPPIPPAKPPQPETSTESLGSGVKNKPIPPIPPAKPPQPETVEDRESQYSVVDMSQLRDKGPEISVVNEEGKRAPLHRVEEELDRHREDANTSRSILETILDAVGDLDLPEEKEKMPSPPPPLPPPNPTPSKKWTEFEDEIPPPIPLHTEDSTHLVETTSGSGSSDHVVIENDIYYTPTPHSSHVPGSGNNNHSPAPPPAVNDSALLPPSPRHSATTLPPAASHSSTPSGKTSRLKIGGVLKAFGKSKSEKRKPLTASDIGRPVGMPRSPSDHAIATPPRHSPSPDHTFNPAVRDLTAELGAAQSEPANNRYTFTGEMGYGLRIPKPKGPRPEPPHWNMIQNSITII